MKRLVLNLIEKKSGNLHLTYEWYDSKPIEGEEKQSQEEFKKSVLEYFEKINKDDLFIIEESNLEDEDLPSEDKKKLLKTLDIEGVSKVSDLKEIVKKIIEAL